MSGLKIKTAKTKATFYRLKNDIQTLLESEKPDRYLVRSEFAKLSLVFEDLLDNFRDLGENYAVYYEVEKIAKLDVELEKIETEFAEIENSVYRCANSRQITVSSKQSYDVSCNKPSLSQDKLSSQELNSEIRQQEQEIAKIKAEIERTIEEYQAQFCGNSTPVEIVNYKPSTSSCDHSGTSPVKDEDQNQGEINSENIKVSASIANTTFTLPVVTSTPVNSCTKIGTHPPQVLASETCCVSNNRLQSGVQTEISVDDNSPIQRETTTSCVSKLPVTQSLEMNQTANSSQQLLTRNPVVPNAQNYPTLLSVNNNQELKSTSEGQTQCVTNQRSKFNTTVYENSHLSFDASRLLTRVSIPKFWGNKKNYESWKAAFYACVDQSNSTPEYKLLRLRECLQGEALKVVENLGHSPAAYDAAKSRLERKYGGARRALTLRLEELNTFKPVKEGNEKDLENLAELLDVVVVNLKDADQEAELGSGLLYITIMRKLNKNLLAKYKQWISDGNRKESVEVLREFIDRESQFLTTATETILGVLKEPAKKERPVTGRAHVTQNGNFKVTDKEAKCRVCSSSHGLWACDKFKKLPVKNRWDIAKENKACFRCLSLFHQGKNCPRSRTCGVNGCDRTHHRLLHEATESVKQETPRPMLSSEVIPNRTPQEGEGIPRTHTATKLNKGNDPEYIALRTVPVIIRNNSKTLRVNALLDDASTKSFINSDVAAQLELEGPNIQLTVNVLNDCETKLLNSNLVDFEIESVDGKTRKFVTAHTTNRVTGNMSVVNWNKRKDVWPHLQSLKFPQLGKRPIVDMLIGVDQADLHSSLQEITGEPGEPIARLTPLGWTCIGYPNGTQPRTNVTFTQYHTTELNELVRRFWEIEEPSPTAFVKPDEKYAIDIASQSLSYSNGRYCVGIPWKREKAELPDNYDMALRRLENTEKRLLKDTQVSESYSNVIKSYLEKGYIEKVTDVEAKPEKIWYLPHFPVLRPDKSTTKTRIVFDASAKQDGISLNDTIHHGPKLQNDLFAVLLRFRCNPIAIICDIAEMYLQINMKAEDRPLHRFLWRDLDQSKQPDVYQFSRIVFGVNSSPFLAQFVSQQNAISNHSKYPLAADTVLNSTYMDDSMDSVKDIPTAIKLREELVNIWSTAGMHARKWLSNSPTVLEDIPPEERASSVNLDHGQLPSTKTLGVMWHPEADMFTFSSKQPDLAKITKRTFLSSTASLFDPLGFLNPFTVRAKIILQKIWMEGLQWDELLGDNLAMQATKWFNELSQLDSIQVPRYLSIDNGMDCTPRLHTFVDASLEAYGAAVYAHYQYEDGTVTNRLITSKSRVAPLQAVSVPRLELMAAVLGLRLTQTVARTLDIPQKDWQFWSDSVDVLYWIRGHSRRFKPFVANRVGEIQAETEPDQWRHVPTNVNPADLLTRGQRVSELATNSKWWNGPDFLHQPITEWPLNKINMPEKPNTETRKHYQSICHYQSKKIQCAQTDLKTPEVNNRLDPRRFSNWQKLKRLTARVTRFVDNCRNPYELRSKGTCLFPEELKDAEIHHIKQAQVESFSDEIKAIKAQRALPSSSKLCSLNPVIDEDGVIRCNSRLQFAECLPWESKYPIILPRKHVVTQLIIKHTHERCLHGGTNLVLSHLSEKFWIISAREAIREWEKKCATCQRNKSSPASQVMAPLLEVRTRMSLRAFNQASVDFGGPFYTKQGRGKTRQKRYLCLFTCLSTRAVHLEMAYSLDTDSFLNAFYRMVSRRGLPSTMISDNGTNFVSANRELKELVADLDKEKIQNSTAEKGVKWCFNTPGAPHFNGVHEIMIKAAKRAIKNVLGDADITDEELMSAIVGAEGLINSRPLTYQSSNASDNQPLTPNHFLHGQMGGQFAPETIDTTAFSPRKRWRRVQELVRHFWHRWLREWLPGLSPRGKWQKTEEDLKPGDVVLVVSPDTPRGKWPLGRIIRTFPGSDGHVRTAEVRVGQTSFRRPVVKLCPIERHSDIT